MSKKYTITDMMVAYAQDAVDMAQKNFGKPLDYSEESIAIVEQCLTELHDNIPKGFLGRLLKQGPSPERIELVSKMFGSYIGEVFRKHHGGSYVFEEHDPGAGAQIALVHPGSGRFWPASKVYKRLTDGPADNVWVYYKAITEECIKKNTAES